ncbi:MAG: PAS and ANTAR domain-containing protein [Mycobacterium sp.]
MRWQADSPAPAAERASAPQHVGWFRFYFEDQCWEWSDEVQRMHGYEPGTVTPTTDLVLSHKHPDDRDQVAATIDHMINTRVPFSTRHRIIDTWGAVHHVVVVGDQLCDNTGEVIGTYGFYTDLTPTTEQFSEDIITAKVAEIAGRRAAIEQTKGMLMLVYGMDEAAAFDLLKWLSQENNIKLRLLAGQIVTDFTAAGDAAIASRSQFDQLLLTAHQRAAGSPARPEATSA